MHVTPTNTAVIVDSACDLPEEFRMSDGVFLLPIGFQIDDKHYRDRRITEMAVSFQADHDLDASQRTRTLPTSTDTIRNFILKNIVDKYENLILLCISSSRSKIYENARAAIKQLPAALEDCCDQSKIKLKHTRIVDTLSVFSGQALLAYYAISLISETKNNFKIDLQKLINLIEKRKDSISTYVIPHDLGYLRARGKMRGEKSIGKIDYAIAKLFGLSPVIQWQRGRSKKVLVRRGFKSALERLFGFAIKAIDQGLSIDVIMLSYSGDIKNIEQSEAYKELSSYARKNGVSIHLTRMSITASIYLGPNSISLSYSAYKSLLRSEEPRRAKDRVVIDGPSGLVGLRETY